MVQVIIRLLSQAMIALLLMDFNINIGLAFLIYIISQYALATIMLNERKNDMDKFVKALEKQLNDNTTDNSSSDDKSEDK